ncbi:CoA transferase [Sulfitobacter sp. PR48]|uniref:CaiB/BaiF CoA transferase family protein n=1 Tax=Sulfitobacter sp. PR48 TaxID=3028383 RepID=UPI00237B821F|nr:CoA transferase [Sulfitobacter sp. PR48]MDD9721089.1 CoA transferase [Sulfitobacter sp. PR48]
MSNASLGNLRILDLSRILAGPSCTQMLGDLGADIIKIERKGVGDDTRTWGPPFVTPKEGRATESAYYLAANRNKRSVEIDFNDPEDLARLLALMETADVVVENFKTGALKKYGLDYSQLAERLPRLVWCSITGFGQTGPNAHRPGYDLLAQGFGGLMSITGEAGGEPMKVGVGITDLCTGLHASVAILAALRHRDATGEGQLIDLALADVQMAMLANQGTNYLTSGTSPTRAGNQHPNIVPYQVFEVRDGHVIVAVGNDEQYKRFCGLIGRPDLAEDPRFVTNPLRIENRHEIVSLIAKTLLDITRDDLLKGMEEKGIPGGPINTVGEALESDQARARGMKIEMAQEYAQSGSVSLIGNPIRMSRTPVTYRFAPPKLGTDTPLAFWADAQPSKI